MSDAGRKTRRTWLRSTIVAVLTATAIVAAGATAHAVRTASRRPAALPANSRAASQPTGPTPTVTPVADPAALLQRLANDVAAGPADPARARFEYIDIRVWESFTPPSATTAGSAPASASASASPVAGPARRIQLWTTGQGAGRAVAVDERRGCPPQSDETIHNLGPFDGPLSSDPHAVRRQIRPY